MAKADESTPGSRFFTSIVLQAVNITKKIKLTHQSTNSYQMLCPS